MKKMVFVLMLIIFSGFVIAVSYNEFISTVRWAFRDYVNNGNNAALSVPELDDLLWFLNTTTPGPDNLDLSAVGPESGETIQEIYDKIIEARDDASNVPSNVNCQNKGQGCGQGRICNGNLSCVKICKDIRDADEDSLIKGKIKYYKDNGDGPFTAFDYCNGNNVKEVVCNPDEPDNHYYKQSGCPDIYPYCTDGRCVECMTDSNCGNGRCRNNRCVGQQPANICFDTDGGKDYGNKGIVHLNVNNRTTKFRDNCTSDSVLREYYCISNDAAYEDHACSQGCRNGKCLGEQGQVCTDTDGTNTNTKGTMTDQNGAHTDYCVNPSVLVEYICLADGTGRSGQLYCSNGCVDGACAVGGQECTTNVFQKTVRYGDPLTPYLTPNDGYLHIGKSDDDWAIYLTPKETPGQEFELANCDEDQENKEWAVAKCGKIEKDNDVIICNREGNRLYSVYCKDGALIDKKVFLKSGDILRAETTKHWAGPNAGWVYERDAYVELSFLKCDFVQPPVPVCTDSDGGIEPNIKGWTWGQWRDNQPPYNYTDRCNQTDNSVWEYYCRHNEVKGIKVACNQGLTCVDGACVSGPQCTDSDGGEDYYVKGTVTVLYDPKYGQNAQFTDICSASPAHEGLLFEYYCNNDGTVGTNNFKCLNGCHDGACISSNSVCKDSDGMNIYQKGYIIDENGIRKNDTCRDDNNVNEYYCDNGGGIATLSCERGCRDGACTSSCTETDGGANIYVKGKLITSDGTEKVDYCTDSGKLKEYFCNNGQGDLKTYTCNNGCQDGACMPDASTCVDSDGGINENVPGRVKLNNEIFKDACTLLKGKVKEKYCENGEVMTVKKPCENGCEYDSNNEAYCKTEACAPNCDNKDCGDDGCGGSCGTCENNQQCNDQGKCYRPGCYDSDNGKKYDKAGYVQIDGGTKKWDRCMGDKHTLVEYYCRNKNRESIQIDCWLSGYSGGCKAATGTNEKGFCY